MSSPTLDKSNVLPFSNPLEKIENPIVEIATITYYRNSLKLFVESNQDIFCKLSEGISNLFQLFIKSCADYTLYADYSISCLDLVSYQTEKEKIQAIANIACYLTVNGFNSEWHLKNINLNTIYFDAFIFDSAIISEINNDPINSKMVFTTSIGEVEFNYSNLSKNLDFQRIQRTNTGNIVIYPVQFTPKIWKDRIMGDSAFDADANYFEKVESALTVLKYNASSYFNWVTKFTNKIIVFDSDSNSHIKSGSWEEAMGLYNLSINHDIYIIAELLVHESSHQYFNLLKKIDDFTEENDCLYYSAAVDKDRPLWAILIAYHAFANIVLFYRMLIDNQAEGKAIVIEREKENLQLVNSLSIHLVDNPYLTHTGKTLFLSLHERLTNKTSSTNAQQGCLLHN